MDNDLKNDINTEIELLINSTFYGESEIFEIIEDLFYDFEDEISEFKDEIQNKIATLTKESLNESSKDSL
ncbi:MAG: hypothetical protein ACRC1M_04670, partial [Methanobacteriaceae archaeon]